MDTLRTLTLAVALTLALSGCSDDAVADPQTQIANVEWQQVQWSGGTLRVALIRPEADAGDGPYPVVIALPWGGGTADLVLGLVDTYWSREAPARGYYVVSPEVLGSSLAQTADQIVPALFDWMDQALDYDPAEVVLTGASNGGRGAFFAATAAPDRFRGIIGMPGRYEGDGSNLDGLAETPVWLLVGEFDSGWVSAAESTRTALEGAGVPVTLDVVSGQGHVMSLDQAALMDWIDAVLGR